MIAYAGPQLAASFRTVRKNTVQIAQDIPEAQYGFSPAPGTKTVAGLLKHIAVAPMLHEDQQRVLRLTTLQGYDFPALMVRWRAEEGKELSKAEIVRVLETKGEDFAAWLDTVTPEFLAETYTDLFGHPKTRFEALLSVKEHEMHHRGQLMLIERILGIEPHLTRRQRERMAARHGALPAAPPAVTARSPR